MLCLKRNIKGDIKMTVGHGIIGKQIDALNDVRLSLKLRQLTSETISRRELVSLVSKTKSRYPDKEVAKALDEVFNEYFVIDLASHKQDNDNHDLSIEQMEWLINEQIKKADNNEENSYYAEENGKGAQRVKTTPYFKGSNSSGSEDKVA